MNQLDSYQEKYDNLKKNKNSKNRADLNDLLQIKDKKNLDIDGTPQIGEKLHSGFDKLSFYDFN